MSNLPALQTLHDVFGYTTFKGEQEAVVAHVTAGGDALVLMPTGFPFRPIILKLGSTILTMVILMLLLKPLNLWLQVLTLKFVLTLV